MPYFVATDRWVGVRATEVRYHGTTAVHKAFDSNQRHEASKDVRLERNRASLSGTGTREFRGLEPSSKVQPVTAADWQQHKDVQVIPKLCPTGQKDSADTQLKMSETSEGIFCSLKTGLI